MDPILFTIWLVSALIVTAGMIFAFVTHTREWGLKLCDAIAMFLVFAIGWVPFGGSILAVIFICIAVHEANKKIPWDRLCSKQLMKPWGKS